MAALTLIEDEIRPARVAARSLDMATMPKDSTQSASLHAPTLHASGTLRIG